MDATMGSIAPTGLKGKLAALEERDVVTVGPSISSVGLNSASLSRGTNFEDFISMQNEELAAQRQDRKQT